MCFCFAHKMTFFFPPKMHLGQVPTDLKPSPLPTTPYCLTACITQFKFHGWQGSYSWVAASSRLGITMSRGLFGMYFH